MSIHQLHMKIPKNQSDAQGHGKMTPPKCNTGNNNQKTNCLSGHGGDGVVNPRKPVEVQTKFCKVAKTEFLRCSLDGIRNENQPFDK